MATLLIFFFPFLNTDRVPSLWRCSFTANSDTFHLKIPPQLPLFLLLSSATMPYKLAACALKCMCLCVPVHKLNVFHPTPFNFIKAAVRHCKEVGNLRREIRIIALQDGANVSTLLSSGVMLTFRVWIRDDKPIHVLGVWERSLFKRKIQ